MTGRGLVLCLAPLWLVGAGCGSESLCQKAHRVVNARNTKGAACVTASMPIDVATCEKTSKNCTEEDVAGIERVIDCYEKLGVCGTAEQASWMDALRACQDTLAPGSSVCLAM